MAEARRVMGLGDDRAEGLRELKAAAAIAELRAGQKA